MTTRDLTTDRVAALASLDRALETESFQHALQQAQWDVPGDIAAWLARAMLLYGLPFQYLVPDPLALPGPNSLRFFYVDANWLDALVDGANSIGVHTGRDVQIQRILQPVLRGAADNGALQWRDEVRNGRSFTTIQPRIVDTESDSTHTAPALNWCGFLLRSPLVSGWPGLEVKIYSGDSEETPPLTLLRLERLAPDLLFCLLPAVPGLITISEPPEGLHFGLGETVLLRHKDGKTVAGQAGTASVTDVAVPWRDEDRGVVNVLALRERIQNAVNGHQNFVGYEVGPANFAVQLLDSAKKVSFKPAAEEGEG